MRRAIWILLAVLSGCGESAGGRDPSDGRGTGASEAGRADGSVGVDAGGDAGMPGASAGGRDFPAIYELVQKMRECGALSEGKYSEIADPFAFDACTLRCLIAAPCAEATKTWCTHGVENPATLKCVASCENLMVTCPETLRGAPHCDGVKDCVAGDDEAGCHYFTCKNGKPIHERYRCDGEAQCADGSDELSCPFSVSSCANGEAPVDGVGECNGIVECMDGSDERDCVKRGLGFACADGSVVGVLAVCDGQPDCMDGSDEKQSCAVKKCN